MSNANGGDSRAEELLAVGSAACSSRRYESAISSLESALSLDVQDESLKAKVEELLLLARSGLAAQESARAEAASYAATGEACMSSHDYVGAIDAYDLALSLHTHPPNLR